MKTGQRLPTTWKKVIEEPKRDASNHVLAVVRNTYSTKDSPFIETSYENLPIKPGHSRRRCLDLCNVHSLPSAQINIYQQIHRRCELSLESIREFSDFTASHGITCQERQVGGQWQKENIAHLNPQKFKCCLER